MSPRRSTRALKTSSRKTNEASPLHDAHASKNQIPAPCPGKFDIDEATLRKLSRAELQKLAKVCLTFLVLNATDTDMTTATQREGKYQEQFDH
jgi:hypothetical protein